MKCTIDKIINIFFRVTFLSIVLFILGFFFANPAQAGGSQCDISPDGGTNTGRMDGPAALKVVFQDADGNAVTKSIGYTLESTNGEANINRYDDGGYNWQESSNSVRMTTCDGANFDIWWYRTINRNFISNGVNGNGWVLFCKNHPSNHTSSTLDLADFKITNIDNLPSNGGSGGGQKGRWQLWIGDPYNTFVDYNANIFNVENGRTKELTFRWVPYGVIYTSKYFPSTHLADGKFDGQPVAVNDASVDLYYDALNTPQKFDTSTANPWKREKIYVSLNWFSAGVQVPAGYKLTKAKVAARNFGKQGWPRESLDLTLTCNNSNYCKTSAFFVDPAYNFYWFGFLDLFFDTAAPASTGNLTCTASGGETYWSGWGIDPNNQGATPVIKLFDGSTLAQTVNGNVAGTETTRIRNDNTNYPNASDTTNYDINVALGQYFRDNAARTVTAKLATTNGDVTLGNIQVGPGSACNPTAYVFPYLQTTGGNIVANGAINGQEVSTTRLGAPDSTSKYTEYLIISAIGGGGPFCSTKNYILTNTSATTGNCGNGDGYGAMPDNLFGVGSDKMYSSVENKYNSLPSSCRSENTPISQISVPTTCPDGYIYKVNGDLNLTGLRTAQGRATILVSGNVTISGDLNYGNTILSNNGLSTLKNLPNLSIVTKGNVKINSNVTNIKASIYSVGYINTCGDKTLPQLCGTSLSVLGSLAAKGGLVLGRVNGANGLTGHSPAELISFYPLSALVAAPGTSSSDFTGTSDSVIIDPAEYQPRF